MREQILTIIDTNGKLSEISLGQYQKQKLVLGRDESICDVVMTDAIVSKIQGTMLLENGRLMYQDEDSRNGTFLGLGSGRRLLAKQDGMVEVYDKDILCIGNLQQSRNRVLLLYSVSEKREVWKWKPLSREVITIGRDSSNDICLPGPGISREMCIRDSGFPSLMDYTLWKRLQYIVKNGNESVHTSKSLDKDDAILSLNILFDLVQWIDYCYGRDYVERSFDESKIPDATKDAEAIQEQYKQVIQDVQKNADKIVNEKDKEIERLLKMNEELRQQMKGQKSKNQKEREYTYDSNMPEWLTRKRYIDADLKAKENCLWLRKKECLRRHTQQQLNDYANQNNPNNKAYKARMSNDKVTKKVSRKQDAKRQAEFESEHGLMYPLDWMCYSNPYDFD